MALSEVMLEAFIAESAMLRARQTSAGSLHTDAAVVIAHDALVRAKASGRTLLCSMYTGDKLTMTLSRLNDLLDPPPVNTVAARRRLADAVLAKRAYPFGARS